MASMGVLLRLRHLTNGQLKKGAIDQIDGKGITFRMCLQGDSATFAVPETELTDWEVWPYRVCPAEEIELGGLLGYQETLYTRVTYQGKMLVAAGDKQGASNIVVYDEGHSDIFLVGREVSVEVIHGPLPKELSGAGKRS